MIYRLERSICLAITLENAWEFFSNPRNLRFITPPSLDMQMPSDPGAEMYPGMIVVYKVHPLFSIPMTWVSEITHVQKPSMFIDEQRFGPYRLWHHQHFFCSVPGGVEVRDIVDYIMPFGFLGRVFHPLFVKRKLEQIFEYRTSVLSERFGAIKSASN